VHFTAFCLGGRFFPDTVYYSFTYLLTCVNWFIVMHDAVYRLERQWTDAWQSAVRPRSVSRFCMHWPLNLLTYLIICILFLQLWSFSVRLQFTNT